MLAGGILRGERVALARGITLVESNKAEHFEAAQKLVENLLPHAGQSIRVGISGVPGAGKSTMIEALGLYLAEKGHKIAVLAIDPSSQRSGGSILGDKTRMERLARNPRAFIRPSPSGGALGGVARKTRESIVLCEAAGYDVTLVETMGVGQGEYAVRNMVDVFVLLQIAGAGDELQGIKRGIMEMADIIVINKADGENKSRAEAARAELRMALHYMDFELPGWKPPVITLSALHGAGIDQFWNAVRDYRTTVEKQMGINERRRRQDVDWMLDVLDREARRLVLEHPSVARLMQQGASAIREGRLSPAHAAARVLEHIKKVFDAHDV